MSGPLFSIPTGVSFVDALAQGLMAEAGDGAFALSDYTVLLPTRRACRALTEAFLRASGGRPLLLPQLQPVGDVDDDELALGEMLGAPPVDVPPAIPGLHRRLVLARTILAWPREGQTLAVDEAARLAAELERLLDQVQTERLSFDALATLVPTEYADHWQHTLKFLDIVTRHWPDILAELGATDPARRRNLMLQALADAWEKAPPPGPVVAAGTTGTVPATADLLARIARLPQGRIVLPGLFAHLEPESWERIRSEATHPQHTMARLLERLNVRPECVRPWPLSNALVRQAEASEPRRRLLMETMRPAVETNAWRSLAPLPGDALAGVARADCSDSAEEAGVAALVLRHALEIPGRTAILVTPDRGLARRVAAEMRRWGVEVDDSGGRPLATTAPGLFMRLIPAALAEFAPVQVLALLKHPLTAAGLPPARMRALARMLERFVYRGPRPAPGFAALTAAVRRAELPATESEPLLAMLTQLAHRMEPFARVLASAQTDLASLIHAHVSAAEAMAEQQPGTGASRLWSGDAGEALAGFYAELQDSAAVIPGMDGAGYAALLEALLEGRVVRPRYGGHPRCAILGPLEARLQSADVVILAGLNEGTWPPDPRPDPWLSRPMRRAFGLPPEERRTGLSAHDFVSAFSARDVVLTRAGKVDGQPTVPSRWLTRLDAVLAATGSAGALAGGEEWRARYAALKHAKGAPPPGIPAPRPPVAARPRRLSVTQIETWMRNPYGIFARHVLGLRRLDPIDADPGAAERGTFIHETIDRFLRAFPGPLPPDAVGRLLQIGEEVFGDTLQRPAVRAFWWPRFERIAEWFVAQEHAERTTLRATATEVRGHLDLDGPAGAFRLTAHADRIDRLDDGTFRIVDYKTGAVPSEKAVDLGFAPQLPLEAAIAAAGGFAGLAAGRVSELAYWRLTGGEPPGAVRRLKADAMHHAAAALTGLRALIATFDDAATPYRPVPRPGYAPRFDDYAHLARIKEWGGERAE